MIASLKEQVGGNHYASMKYQPIQFAMKCQLNPVQFSIVKYVSRYKNKNGLQDLEKAMHFCEIGLQLDNDDKYDDDTLWLHNELHHYITDNRMSPLQDMAISNVVMTKNYTSAMNYIGQMMEEYRSYGN